MWKIDTGDAVSTQPVRPAQGVAKFFANRTIVPSWWLNMVQNEIWNALVRFGITPSKSNDNQLADAIQAAVDAQIVTEKTIAITGHPTGITKTSAGEWQYNIADFLGSGIDTSKIRTIYIYMYSDMHNGQSCKLQATYPWDLGTLHSVYQQYTHGNNGDARQQLGVILEVPINPGQAAFKLKVTGSNPSMTIRAARMSGPGL